LPQARRKSPDSQPIGTYVTRGLREAALFALAALALYLLLALASYHPSDPGWSHSGVADVVSNGGGRVGAWFADVFLYLFGYLAYLFPVMVAISGLIIYRIKPDGSGFDSHLFAMRWSGFVLTLAGGCGLATLHFSYADGVVPLDGGGVLGQVVGGGLVGILSPLGSSLFLLTLFMIGVTFFTGLSWLKVMDVTGRVSLYLVDGAISRLQQLREELVARKARKAREETVKVETARKKRRTPPKIEIQQKPKVVISERVEKERQVQMFEAPSDSVVPPLALLDEERPFDKGFPPEVLEAMSRQLELKLKDFGIEVEVTEVHPGPVITRFEMLPAPGVKVSRITNLAKDLARSLSITSVRVVEVIPGKSVIGIEIPNEHREMVVLSEILKSHDFNKASSPLTLALGKDIGGLASVTDLAKMPHLLVAGTTGSGKSVAVNAMILSLLYKSTPQDVRMIMIDPKMLELSVYEGIPHLLTPVVTDMKEAANGLRWCVGEMERRYKLMAALGVRNIAGYNRKVKDAEEAGTPIPDPLFKPEESMEMTPPNLEHLPYIVVVVDEFADMMMVVGKKVEELIARLAQKARAAGIHLILATQRPSVDVITGLIKANIPTRIAFQVSTKIDSRTILDQGGAEQLLGHGDMLYLAPGTGLPVRIHGAFVSDQEVHRVVESIKGDSEPQYLEEILQDSSDPATMLPGESPAGGDAESDPLYDEAVMIVTESRRASISGVQRRLKIGYNRAARMIEDMELAGIVSELQSNGSREVLVPPPPKH